MPKSDAQLDRENRNSRRRRASSPATAKADWLNANIELLSRAVRAVARMGGALRLGYTRDGGAYAVGIYGDGEPFTEYIKPDEDINEYLRGLCKDYE